MLFIREKRLKVNNYMEVDIIPRTTEGELAARGIRGKKEKFTKPAQQNFNNKQSARYFGLLANGHFGKGDYYSTKTYSDEFLPATPEDAEKIVSNYLKRLRRRYKKANKELKYMFVTEYQLDEDGKYITRIHHHFLIGAGISRDEIEECWSSGRGKKKKQLGRVTIRKILPGSDGIKALINYLTKKPRWKKGKKNWSRSRNISKPEIFQNDSKYSRKKVEKYALSNDYGFEELSKKYPNYDITEIEPAYYEDTGWHIYLKMWKKTGSG